MCALAVLLLSAAMGFGDVQASKADVLVIELINGAPSYQLRGKPLDRQRLLSDVRNAFGDVRADTLTVLVLVGEGVPLDEVYMANAVLGKIGTFRGIRYFHFSRKSQVMVEFMLKSERWRLRFDGTLVRSTR